MAHIEEVRKQALKLIKEGKKVRHVAMWLNVSENRLHCWKRTPEKTKADKAGPKKAWKIDAEKLEALIEETPDAYQEELAEHFDCTPEAICIALKRQGISRKKNVGIRRKK